MVKFSHGCWHPAQDTIIDWAVEVVKSEKRSDSLHFVTVGHDRIQYKYRILIIEQASKPINHRGDSLNNPTLTHNLSSPMDDVLLLSSTHWKAQKSITNGPNFELFPHGLPQPSSSSTTSATGSTLMIEAGKLRSTVSTASKAFNIDFEAGGELLTQLGWRSIGYVKEETTALHPKANYTDPNKGKRWVTYQLKLAVGAKVFGLGERFGPFQKNGQVCI
jgi:alpha-D-xyloside xylohydrolase